MDEGCATGERVQAADVRAADIQVGELQAVGERGEACDNCAFQLEFCEAGAGCQPVNVAQCVSRCVELGEAGPIGQVVQVGEVRPGDFAGLDRGDVAQRNQGGDGCWGDDDVL